MRLAPRLFGCVHSKYFSLSHCVFVCANKQMEIAMCMLDLDAIIRFDYNILGVYSK